MTTTPGYTVEALQTALYELLRRLCTNTEEQCSLYDWTIARAAELTQVAAQSVERASPAKDGGEQPEPIAWMDRGISGNGRLDICRLEPENRHHVNAFPVYAQPLASQMHPQSAVQGWKDKLTNIRNILGGRAEQGDPTCLKALWAVDELIIACATPQPPQGEVYSGEHLAKEV